MREIWMKRIRWILGVLSPWVVVWFLLGIRILPALQQTPNPFVKEIKLTGVMVAAVREWIMATLVAYLVVGLLLALLAHVAFSMHVARDKAQRLDFIGGLLLGGGTLLWFHAALYWAVPVAMASLPVLRALPMGVAFVLLGGTGGGLMYLEVRRAGRDLPWLRTVGALVLVLLPLLVPHDSFRCLMPQPSRLDPSTPRVILVGLDAMRQDLFEELMPTWKAPGGVHTLAHATATRKLWNLTLGADPEAFKYSLVMPFRWELEHPEHMKLLRHAEQKGLRTAFVINDSLSPAFGLQPNLFSSVKEPDGGWKYWFTLGYGTAWPVYSWVQNYYSIVETSNPWSDTSVYWRDVERAMEEHHWVGSHLCDLHVPITLRRSELRAWRGWAWLGDSANAYRSSMTPSDLAANPARQTWRGDALLQYRVRMNRILKELEPKLVRWTSRYPALNGVVFSDHGETHVAVQAPNGQSTHLSGMHGYWADAESSRIALHPFGCTTHRMDASQVWTLLDLRDSIARWIQNPARPLHLEATSEGWLAHYVSMQATFLVPEEEREYAVRKAGLKADDLMSSTYLLPSGIWFVEHKNSEAAGLASERVLCHVLAKGPELVVFNPMAGGKWERIAYLNYRETGRQLVDKSFLTRELSNFQGRRPTALP